MRFRHCGLSSLDLSGTFPVLVFCLTLYLSQTVSTDGRSLSLNEHLRRGRQFQGYRPPPRPPSNWVTNTYPYWNDASRFFHHLQNIYLNQFNPIYRRSGQHPVRQHRPQNTRQPDPSEAGYAAILG